MSQNVTFPIWLALIALLTVAMPAQATSLAVSPTRVEIARGASQTTMTVKARGRGSSVVQVRIFRWIEGQDAKRLAQTSDVVVSPPMARLNGRQELTVRLLRTTKRRLHGRECYRVLVDRLPDAREKRGAINLRIRHSVPVCFNG